MTNNKFILRTMIAVAVCLASTAIAFAQEEETGVVIYGVTWATCNVGASTPEGYGNYYTFDEAQRACPTGWRLPTIEESEQLGAVSVWAKQNGVKGRRLGFGGNTIFLPAAGFRYHSNGLLNFGGKIGCYHSSTVVGTHGYCLFFQKNEQYLSINTTDKLFYGVRCVKE